MTVFLIGVVLLSAIVGLFWLKDRLASPTLSRAAYSGLTARLAVVGAVLTVLGLLSMLVDAIQRWFA